MLADVFENFQNISLETYELDLLVFLLGLAWKADRNMLLMVKKGIRGGMCHDIQKYAKANKKYVKDYDISIEM